MAIYRALSLNIKNEGPAIIGSREAVKPIFTCYIGTEENIDKISSSLLNTVEKIVEEAFMESPNGIIGLTTLGNLENDHKFEIFLYSDFYKKHIGKLVKEQRDKELTKINNKILKIRVETVGKMFLLLA